MNNYLSRCLLICSMLGLIVGPSQLSAVESASPAQRIAVEVLKQHAARFPIHANHLNELALGLHSGTVSLAEAEQVLRIIQLLQPVSGDVAMGAAPSQTGQAAMVVEPTQSPQDILSALDEPSPPVSAPGTDLESERQPEPLPTSIEALEQWAGTRSPNLEPEKPDEAPAPEVLRAPAAEPVEEAAPAPADPVRPLVTASPTLPSDQDDLSELNAKVRLVQKRTVGEQELQMVFVDQGSEHGLEKGQRLRAERNGELVVLLSVFNVKQHMAVAVVLDGTWGEQSGRQVRQGDLVVRDR